MNEIERKFLVTELPNVPFLERYESERYLLPSDEGTEERVTHSGNKYFYEKKHILSDTERTRNKREISKGEFDSLKAHAHSKLVRETLVISVNPKTVIQVYKGEHKGLMRAEVEFENHEAADRYKPETWMGREITGTLVARDSSLSNMTSLELLAQTKV